MRCPKCGYISFDYLDRCLKCRADLTGERRKLNLVDVPLNPISLQKITEQMPQWITQAKSRNRGQAKEETLPRSAAKAPLPEIGPEIFLEGLGSLDLGTDPRKSKGPELKSEELELSIEGLEVGPKRDL